MKTVLFSLIGSLFKDPSLKAPTRLTFIGCCILLAKISITFVPMVFGRLIDTFAASHPPLLTVPLGLVLSYGAVRFASSAFDHLKEMISAKILNRMIRSLSLTFMDHIHHLSHRFYLSRSPGGVSQAFQQGIRGLNAIFSSLIFGFIPLFAELIFMCIAIFLAFNGLFLLQLLGIAVVYFVSMLYLTQLRLATLRAVNTTEAQINAVVVENLANFETVKYFSKRDYEIKNLDSLLKKQETLNIKSTFQFSFLRLIQACLLSLILTLYLYYNSYQLSLGLITVGQLVTLMTYLLQLFTPLEILAYEQDHFRKALIDVELMFSILRERPTVVDQPKALDLALTKGTIQFKDVSFGYKEDRLILQDVSLTIPSKKTVAIVGKTGSGKTTLSRLLLRFYDVKSGHILIDGQDIRDVTQESLRASIGTVSQEVTLFNNTIYYNIGYSMPEACPEDIYEAAKLAHFHDFILTLPQQYDTAIGERGLKLSGGEKQRLALARALLKKPKILIFDEATASLDTETEKVIQQNIAHLKHKHTIIIIAHRLTTIMNADKIFLLNKGRILEEGTHRNLLHKKGAYFSLWGASGEQAVLKGG